MNEFPTLEDQLNANLVTTLTNSILEALARDQAHHVVPETPHKVRTLPAGVYICNNRYYYATLASIVDGKRVLQRVARGPLYDFSPSALATVVEALEKAKQDANI